VQFSEAVKDFLRFCAVERRLSEHTIQAYAADLADFRRRLPSGLSPADVTEAELRRYLEWMVDDRNLASATVRRRLACLRSFFRHLCGEAVDTNPFSTWHPDLPRPRRLPRALSRTEATTLVSACLAPLPSEPSDRNFLRIAVPLMIATGIRVGELCRVTIDDVAPDGSTVRIHGKGSRDRVAYISGAVLQRELSWLMDQRRREPASAPTLFVNRHGGPLKPQSVRTKLRRYSIAAGLARRVTPHMLRHTAATLLIESGVDIRFVQRHLGHSSIATTEIYTHVSDESLRTTLAKADVLQSLIVP
jgi:site-specific recombinase XerD